MKNHVITVNGIEFVRIPNEKFIVYGTEDKLPFMESIEVGTPPESSARIYRAMIFEGKFYAPKILP